jgi:hypothetical protein
MSKYNAEPKPRTKTKYHPDCEPLPTVIVPAQPGWTILHYSIDATPTLVKTTVAAWQIVDVRDIDQFWPTLQAFPITHNAWANSCYRGHEGVLCDPNGNLSDSLEHIPNELDALSSIKDNIQRREAENAKRNAVEAAS